MEEVQQPMLAPKGVPKTGQRKVSQKAKVQEWAAEAPLRHLSPRQKEKASGKLLPTARGSKQVHVGCSAHRRRARARPESDSASVRVPAETAMGKEVKPAREMTEKEYDLDKFKELRTQQLMVLTP